jgi:hypothetical protein
MEHERIIAWLRRKQRQRTVAYFVGSALAFAVGLLVLFITYWLTYVVLVVGTDGVSAASVLATGKHLTISHGWRTIICLGFIALLFVGAARRRADEIPESPPQLYTGSLPKLRMLSTEIALLTHPLASAGVISYWLLVGPRMIIGSFQLLLRAFRKRGVRLADAAAAFSFISDRSSSVSRDEIMREFPALNWPAFVAVLGEIDGVLPLEPDWARVTLSQELRLELQKMNTD